jgi:capsular exopolysaccharide synthesis family protein
VTFVAVVRILRRRWAAIILMVVLGGLGAAFAVSRIARKYEAETQLFLVANGSGPAGTAGAYDGQLLTQELDQSLVGLVSGQGITGPVVNQLHLSMSPQQLAGEITATSPINTVLIDIAVRDTSPTRAAAIANSVARNFTSFVSHYDGASSRSLAPVFARVSQTASPPTSPVSPKRTEYIAIGFTVGLVLGLCLAGLLELFDDSMRTAEDVERSTDLAVLMEIPRDRDARRHPVLQPEFRSRRAEAYRQLRTGLEFARADEPLRAIAVTSPRGGAGRTTTAVNLVASLAETSASVVLIEADFVRPRVGRYLRIASEPGLSDVLRGDIDLADALQLSPQVPGARVLASGPVPPNPSELLSSRRMTQCLAACSRQFDYVLIDCPPVLEVADAAIIGGHVDGVVMLARYGETTVHDLRLAISRMRQSGAHALELVFTMVPPRDLGLYRGPSSATSLDADEDDGSGTGAYDPLLERVD